MNQSKSRPDALVWCSVGFCALISVMALAGWIFKQDGWQPVFFCFLPMCFVYMGLSLLQTRRDLEQLRSQLTELQTSSQAAAGPA